MSRLPMPRRCHAGSTDTGPSANHPRNSSGPHEENATCPTTARATIATSESAERVGFAQGIDGQRTNGVVIVGGLGTNEGDEVPLHVRRSG